MPVPIFAHFTRTFSAVPNQSSSFNHLAGPRLQESRSCVVKVTMRFSFPVPL